MVSIWTKDTVKELKQRFGNEATRDIATDMGISYEALKKFASRMGLRKSRKRLKTLGRK